MLEKDITIDKMQSETEILKDKIAKLESDKVRLEQEWIRKLYKWWWSR